MKRSILALAFLAALVGPSSAAEPAADARPILVPNTGGHTMRIHKLVFTPNGKQLISVGKDWGIHVWDVASGELTQTIHTPCAPGIPGMNAILNAACSPDGSTVAVNLSNGRVFLVSLDTGRLQRIMRIPGVGGLQFSPHGTTLVAFGGDEGILAWDTSTWNAPTRMALPPHRILSSALAVSPDGLCVAAATTRGGLIWSLSTGKLLATLADPDQGHSYGVAWSPNGKTVVLGGFQRFRVWSREGKLLRTIPNLGNAIQSILFAGDSRHILFAQNDWFGPNEKHDCVLWDLEQNKEKKRFSRRDGKYVGSVAVSPNGKTIATSSGQDIFLWNLKDGAMIKRLGARTAGLYSAGWNQEGTAIASGELSHSSAPNHQNPLEFSFHLPSLTLSRKLEGEYQRSVTRLGRDEIGLEKGYPVYRKDGKLVQKLFKGPFTFLQKGFLVHATETKVNYEATDAGSKAKRHRWTINGSTALAPSPDGRFLLCACDNGTIHVLDPKLPQKPLLSLLVAGQDWIAWTPKGYYAASSGGESLMGWAIDNGPDRLATFYPAGHFRRSLYRPDIVRVLLEAGSIDKAVLVANAAKKNQFVATKVVDVLPPLVVVTSPDQIRSIVTEPQVTVRALAKSTGQHPIVSFKLLVNGRPHTDGDAIKRKLPFKLGEVRKAWTLQLSPGTHEIAVLAESAVSKAVSETVMVTFEPSRGAQRDDDDVRKDKKNLPKLYVLAIGISDYPGSLKLTYAAKDARVLGKTLQATSAGLYRDVEVKYVVNKEATRSEILKGFTWLKKQMTQHDVAIVSFAGHGSKDSDGRFYLLPVDVDKEDLVSSAVPGEQIKSLLSTTPGRIVMMLDACHSGAVDNEKRRNQGSLTDDLVRDLISDDYGVVVMCSSTGNEYSLESADVEHGYFTLALVEGLTGKADYDKDGVVYLNELDLYVSNRVKELSKGRQHPVTNRPTSVRSFPLSRPMVLQAPVAATALHSETWLKKSVP